MIDRFKESFREEAYELLNALEQSLLLLEEHPDNTAEIDAIFRGIHTIKGSAAMFGFQRISQFTHEIENSLDNVRNGSIKVSKRLIDLTLKARDHIRLLLDSDDDESEEINHASEEILLTFRNLPKVRKETPPFEVHDPSKETRGGNLSDKDSLLTWRIRFAPHADIMKNGTRPLQLLSEIQGMGDCTLRASNTGIPLLQDIDCETCYLSWDILLTSTCSNDEILDVFIFSQDHAQIDIKIVDTPDDAGLSPVTLGQILIDRGSVAKATIDQAVQQQQQQQRRLGALLEESGVPLQDITAALNEQEHIKRSREKVQQDMSAHSIRVSSNKLDILVDLVGELVTLQARLSQTTQDFRNPSLENIAESFERLVNELRDTTMGMRMLPMGSTFSKFKRLVRDLSSELGKNVEMITEGAETEIDKTVLEKLNDPLVHLIRNSLDHGLETPEQRQSAGKSAIGTIKLIAEHAGASVSIYIIDDGRGLDVEGIKAKALERGLINPSTILSDEAAQELIFLPGFSTAKSITKVSGRGVGLDVVKKELENLGGVIHIQSKKGMGTTIRLDIPLTLAIIEGLLVRVGEEHYVLPLGIVEECLEYQQILEQRGKDGIMLQYRNELLPLVRLRDIFSNPEPEPEIQQVVVVNAQGYKIGIILDHVIGDHQTVIKNLGKMYRNAEGISGATILGDGSVALILDVGSMVTHIMGKPRVAV